MAEKEEYAWIKKLAKGKKKEDRSQEFSDYVDKEKLEEVKESTKNRFQKLKQKIFGK